LKNYWRFSSLAPGVHRGGAFLVSQHLGPLYMEQRLPARPSSLGRRPPELDPALLPTTLHAVREVQRHRFSFIPWYSRTVAGYIDSLLLGMAGFRGLLVYDPWPPNAGIITRWENFATQTYQYTYSARVSTI
jgi:hypothetical protein